VPTAPAPPALPRGTRTPPEEGSHPGGRPETSPASSPRTAASWARRSGGRSPLAVEPLKHREVLGVSVTVACHVRERELSQEGPRRDTRRSAERAQRPQHGLGREPVLGRRVSVEDLVAVLERERDGHAVDDRTVEPAHQQARPAVRIGDHVSRGRLEAGAACRVEEERLVLHQAGVLRWVELEDVPLPGARHRQIEHRRAHLVLDPGQTHPVDPDLQLGQQIREPYVGEVGHLEQGRNVLRVDVGGDDLHVTHDVTAHGQDEGELVVHRRLQRPPKRPGRRGRRATCRVARSACPASSTPRCGRRLARSTLLLALLLCMYAVHHHPRCTGGGPRRAGCPRRPLGSLVAGVPQCRARRAGEPARRCRDRREGAAARSGRRS
jgi:hypothetical protein